MGFEFKKLYILEVILVIPRAFANGRGFFLESYRESDFRANGITFDFKQDNHSKSSKNVLRGLHYQLEPYAQGKLLKVVTGRIFDVAVDIRKGSPTFGNWVSAELSEENKQMLWIPPGFAHGFLSLEDNTNVLYKSTNEYNKDIVIVIPTANHEGEFAKNCANSIFKGQQIVFVESNGPFFNYARSGNYGLKYALKYNPKWIILSNDDILHSDPIDKLTRSLSSVDYNTPILAIVKQDRWNKFSFRKRSVLFDFYEKFNSHSNYVNIINKFYITNVPFSFSSHYNLKGRIRTIIIKLLTKEIFNINFSGDFIIFSERAILDITKQYGSIFDETFINCCEDSDLYIRTILLSITPVNLDFNLKADIGGSLGQSKSKNMRGIVSLCYLDQKFKRVYLNSLLKIKSNDLQGRI